MLEPRQEPRRPDVGEKADADLGHREDEAFVHDPMGRVHHEPDAAAHRDAARQDDDRLGIGLDPSIELIFLAPERQLGVMVAGAAEIVQTADVSARPPRG